MSRGSNVTNDYLNADFQLAIPWGRMDVFDLQSGDGPTSFGSGVNFAANQSPWTGQWRWINNPSDQFTPCNVDQNKGYWRAVFKKAARPRYGGIHGHVVLHRRFPLRGISKVCKPLTVTTGSGSYNCTNTCPPLDWYPPALESIFECGSWNQSSCSAV